MLYHGTNKQLSVLDPFIPGNRREQHRVGSLEKVLYASSSYEEALVHAISKSLGIEGHAGYGYTNGTWSISLPASKESLHSSLPIYVYELDEKDFTLEPTLGEWVTDKSVVPKRVHKSTVTEALSHFREVKLVETKEIGGHETWI